MEASIMKTARNVTWLSVTRLVFAICLVAIGRAGLAAEPAADLKHCAALENERERLQCYDSAAERGEAKPAGPLEQLGREPSPAVAPGTTPPTPLSVRWELEPATKQGTWLIRPYEPIFIMPVRYRQSERCAPVA
jgi:phospholipase A1